ncbi:MAG: OsmC family protein [Flavobacteriales bacterium]
MITSEVKYLGGLRTTAVHVKSNNEIITDAPIDNYGKGEAFSPTDLIATGLGSCMITLMGIKADNLGINLEGTKAEVIKRMSVDDPRRIKEIRVTLIMNQNFDDKTKVILEKIALTCPVAKSLHPELKQTVEFLYP